MNTQTQVLPDAFLRMQAVQQPQCTQEIMGIAFTRIDLEGVVRAVMDRDPTAPFAYVATPNAVHVVGVDRKDPLFVSGLQGAWIRTCDSRIVRRLACRMFATDLPLATGSDLTARLFENEIVPGDTVTLVGGTDEMVRRLGERFGVGGIRHYVPPMGFVHRPDEIRDCIGFIEDNPSRFVFIACGAPQSEFLAQCVVQSGGATGVGLCVGASLLFVTGMLKRAPKGWQKLGLEWLYRLTQEPSRLWKRLFVSQLPVLWVALKHCLSAR